MNFKILFLMIAILPATNLVFAESPQEDNALKRAELVYEFQAKGSRLISENGPIVPYKISLSLGGEIIENVGSTCGANPSTSNNASFDGLPLPRMAGVSEDSAHTWFTLEKRGQKYMSNPRISYLVNKVSQLTSEEKRELIRVYLCIWDLNNPNSR